MVSPALIAAAFVRVGAEGPLLPRWSFCTRDTKTEQTKRKSPEDKNTKMFRAHTAFSATV